MGEETHLMSYEGEEFLNIYTKAIVDVPQNKDPRRDEEKTEKNRERENDKAYKSNKTLSKKN